MNPTSSAAQRDLPTSGADFDRVIEEGASLRGSSPERILRWAAERFPSKITFATGFGPEGCVLLDLIGRLALPIDLFTLDTNLLFAETYQLWKKLEQRYGFRIRGIQPRLSLEAQAESCGPALWDRDPDRCCEIRKVLPLRMVLSGFDAWLSAIRRDQTKDRGCAKVVEWDSKFELIKVNPLIEWTTDDVWAYLRANGVPYNALHEQGYPSIGCVPCTSRVAPGEDPRAGRWRGRAKTECGLHDRRPAPSVLRLTLNPSKEQK